MDKFDRIYALHKLLSVARYPVPRSRIEQTLECKRVTVSRIVNYMRDFLGAPIEYDPKANGYLYKGEVELAYELPGLWFTAQELQALVAINKVINDLQPGLLEEQLRPFYKRIDALLQRQQLGRGEAPQRIRILTMGARSGGNAFQAVAEAVLQRKQIIIDYHSRSDDQLTQRTLSPQRVVHYRDNWYLDAYCHYRNQLRTFSIDRIKQIELLNQHSTDIDEQQLNAYYADAYGIFSGQAEHSAVLHFSATVARWVADEIWHPQQQGRFLENGEYELILPYGNASELLMDILKYGPEVKVIEPKALKRAVIQRLTDTLGKY